jgi:putative transposase
MIRDYQAITKTWFEKGRQRIIPTYGKHKGVKLLGVLNYETGHVYCKEAENGLTP